MLKAPFLLLLILSLVAKGQEKVNFYEDIAPIIFTNCSGCHSQGKIGPMALTNYEEVHAHMHTIRYATMAGLMPPWQPDPTYSHFQNERILSEEEVDIIGKWIRDGGTEGPKSAEISYSEFQVKTNARPTPDLTICMDTEYSLPGNNEDVYRSFVIPSNLSQTKKVSSIEFVPGNLEAVHHSWIFVDTLNEGRQLDKEDVEPGFPGLKAFSFESASIFPAYLPGFDVIKYPKIASKSLYKNSDIIFQIHYSPTPKKLKDKSCINVFYAKGDPQREVKVLNITETYLKNPPLELKPEETKKFYLEHDIPKAMSVITVIPHGHFRMKNFKAYGLESSGDTIPLVNIKDWDFNWQGSYTFNEYAVIPAKSKIIVESIIDNTSENPFNPYIPPQSAKLGLSSYDEMLEFIIEYMDYEDGDEKRKIN